MSSKTRKLIWSVPIMATLAIVGALAAFVVLGTSIAQAQATLPPEAPIINVATAGNTTIDLIWTAPVEGGVPAFDAYSIQVAASATQPAADSPDWEDATTTAALDNTATRQASLTGLDNDEPYFVRIAAMVSTVAGPYAVNGPLTPAAPTVPDAPVVTIKQGPLTASTVGDVSDLTVTWTVADDGGLPILSYALTVKQGAEDEAPVTLDPATATEHVIEDVLVGTTVIVSVTATNTVGDDGGVSPAGTASDTVTPPDVSELIFIGITVKSDSTSGGGAPQFTVSIPSLPGALPVGSSIVLYLEDDFQEPASIPATSIYFVADSPVSEQTGNGARVYAGRAATIETDDYFDPTKSDISIRVFIPDMCTTDTPVCQSANGPARNQRLQMVIEDTSGIKNPTEFGSHSADVRVLGPTDSVPLIGPAGGDPKHTGIAPTLSTLAKISLSDSNNTRGYEMTVTATGFNDKTTAGAYVLVQQSGTPTCADVVNLGASVGSAIVGSDDVASISFEVTSPTFSRAT